MLSGYKTIIGAIVHLLGTTLALFDVQIGDEAALSGALEKVAEFVLIIGGFALTVYGRVAAKKDLGAGGALE